MVEIDDIRDRESFEAWLKQEDLPHEQVVWLAHRSLLRVLPLLWTVYTVGGREALPIQRAALIAGVASHVPSIAISTAAAAAATDAYHSGANAIHGAAENLARSAALSDLSLAAIAVSLSARVTALPAATRDDIAPYLWRALQWDARSVGEGKKLFGSESVRPLWRLDQKPLWADDFAHAKPNAENSDIDWSFWIDWYQRHLDGRPHDLALLQRIALSDLDPDGDQKPEDFDPFWEGTDAEVLARINAIVEQHRLLNEVRDLKALLASEKQATANLIQRSHNRPPELVDTEVEIVQRINEVSEQLDAAEEELERRQPDRTRLKAIGAALKASAKYLAGLCDAALTEAAKTVGKAVAVVASPVIVDAVTSGRLMDLAQRLIDWASTFVN